MTELVSTRGLADEPVNYVDALLQGRASDGGLYVTEEFPHVTVDQLHALVDQPYEEVFNFVKGRLIGDDIPYAEQTRITAEAYAPEKFPEAREGNLVPVTQIGDDLYVENISLGPTGAFKDMPLQPLALDMEYALEQADEYLDGVGVTSGDTGTAAEAAFKGLGRVTLFMMSPQDGMSTFQKAHMGEQTGGNIHNLSIRAPFDDLNDLLDRLKSQPEFANIAAVNSINWGRVVGQIPYYFAGYLQVVGNNIGQEIDVIVPSGNMGDALAAHYARRMGLPLREVIFANNENNALHNLVQSGVYHARKSEITSSPSMDICKPKNYERLLFELMEGDSAKVADYMQRFVKTGRVALSEYGLPSTAIKDAGFDSGSSSHADRIESIRWAYDSSGYVIDSHTADAVTVARKRELKRPTLCMQTALSVKSEPTVKEALRFLPERPDQFKEVGLGSQSDGFVSMPYSLEAVAAYIRQHRIAKQPVTAAK